MCGRTACTLAPDELCKACSYPSTLNSKKIFQVPSWKDHPGTYTYIPSTNVAPTMFTPVLIKNKTLECNEGPAQISSPKYVVQPMMWGLIPSFYKGESPKGHGFKTNNCRLEDIEEKKIFKPSLNKGQRCVVLCEGFYEWQTTKGSKNKQPYFVHAQQTEGMEIWKKENWLNGGQWNEEEGWKGAKILKMAGLYSKWKSSEGETVYSYSVITMQSGKNFEWLHHRIPAVLETFEDVENWLEEEDYKIALSRLINKVEVSSYPVSTLVNNSRNRDERLFYPVDIEEKKVVETPSSKFMSAWLSSAKFQKREIETEDKDKIVKKIKKEEKKPEGISKWLIKSE